MHLADIHPHKKVWLIVAVIAVSLAALLCTPTGTAVLVRVGVGILETLERFTSFRYLPEWQEPTFPNCFPHYGGCL